MKVYNDELIKCKGSYDKVIKINDLTSLIWYKQFIPENIFADIDKRIYDYYGTDEKMIAWVKLGAYADNDYIKLIFKYAAMLLNKDREALLREYGYDR